MTGIERPEALLLGLAGFALRGECPPQGAERPEDPHGDRAVGVTVISTFTPFSSDVSSESQLVASRARCRIRSKSIPVIQA